MLKRTYNICFGWEIRKLNFRYALLTKVLSQTVPTMNIYLGSAILTIFSKGKKKNIINASKADWPFQGSASMWIMFVIFNCLCHTVMPVSYSFAVTCPERVVYDVFLWVWHSPIRCAWSGIVINCIDPDLCIISYCDTFVYPSNITFLFEGPRTVLIKDCP